MHKKIDYLKTQLHAGVSALNGEGLYHTDTKGSKLTYKDCDKK